ncbi:MYG1 family protein [Candidatus Nomurabacteria bacterium]|nr:MYG1 family protein [Candidatus Nomurabacteria bacterium]
MKNIMKESNKILITHDGSFHTDDIFACAALSVLLENKKEKFNIIRTRDEEIIRGGDYVFDVGGIYSEKLNRFDHHQIDGAGKRDNGIEYSSLGLVWKKFGKEITGKKEVADFIEQKLVLPIDANDNGIDLCKNNFKNISLYTINDVLSIFSGTALEDLEKDKQFLKALVWAKEILKREIKKANDQIEITKIIRGFYEKAKDKRLVVINAPKVSRYEIWDSLQDFPEPLFVVYGDNEDWSVVAMRKEKNSFENRKSFPTSWAGLRAKELRDLTGVKDAVFCHNNLFLSVAKSKEGAIKLAELALLELNS